jgi:hypothetical protein
MGCKGKELEDGKTCWDVRLIEATLYQGSNCMEPGKKVRLVLNPSDRKVQAVIKEALGKRKTNR